MEIIYELIGYSCCNILLYMFVAQCSQINNDTMLSALVLASTLNLILTIHFGRSCSARLKEARRTQRIEHVYNIKGNANGNQYNEGFTPHVENLANIIRPFLDSEKSAEKFSKAVEDGLAPFCANQWKRSVGKIEKDNYFVVYATQKRLYIGEAVYYGNGKWHIFEPEGGQNVSLTVLAFSETIDEEANDDGKQKR